MASTNDPMASTETAGGEQGAPNFGVPRNHKHFALKQLLAKYAYEKSRGGDDAVLDELGQRILTETDVLQHHARGGGEAPGSLAGDAGKHVNLSI